MSMCNVELVGLAGLGVNLFKIKEGKRAAKLNRKDLFLKMMYEEIFRRFGYQWEFSTVTMATTPTKKG